MDLKGPLSDTRLKLYPSEDLITYIQTIPIDAKVPVNIRTFFKKAKDALEVKIQNNSGQQFSYITFTNTDIENLKKIKEEVKKNMKGDEPGTKQLDEHDEVSITSNNISDTSKDFSETSKDASDSSKTEQSKAADSTDTLSQNSFEVIQPEREGPFLNTSDIFWLYAYLEEKRKTEKKVPYLHELLEGTAIDTPRNTVLKRNPVLEARCVKLRAQQEAREYRKMTKGVDNVRIRFPDDSISYQLKQINRQLIAIGQFIISIFAGFLFGFKGVEWMIGELDFGFKLLLGVMCALIIALAEIYFLAKKLNEELNVPETVQLGGPPQFVDKKTYAFEPRTNKEPVLVNKEHQD